MAVALDLHVLADRHRPGPRHAPEVVAAEVDEHHVLGALLRVALELLGQEGVLAGVGAARPRPGDRVGRQLVALDLEQQLRATRRRPRTSGVRTKNRYGLGLTRRSARYSPIPSSVAPGRRVVRQVERLAPREHDLDRLAGRDRVLGDLDGVDVLVAPEARLDRRLAASRAWRRPRSGRAPAPIGRAGQLGRGRARGPLERLEDRRLGDPVAALEVGRLGVERRDRRQRVGQVVEDEHEVGLDERGRRRRRPGRGRAAARSARTRRPRRTRGRRPRRR